MKDQKGYNANIGKDDVMVTLDEYADRNKYADTHEEYANEKDNGFPYPEDSDVKPIPNNEDGTTNDTDVDGVEELSCDEECEEEEIAEDNYYQESLENNQLYKLEREKYIDSLETIKELTKKLLEFL